MSAKRRVQVRKAGLADTDWFKLGASANSPRIDRRVTTGSRRRQPTRRARYDVHYRTPVQGPRALGRRRFLKPALQAPIIVTFPAPQPSANPDQRLFAAAGARGLLRATTALAD